jgi:hypothetical protein
MNAARRSRHRRATAKPIHSQLGRAAAIEVLEERRLLTLLGQQLFPLDNAWNQQITNAPVAANSPAIINNITTLYSDGRFHPDFGQDTGGNSLLYGIPINVVHGNTQPNVHVVIDTYASESDIQDAPIPADAVIEGDNQNGPVVGLNNRGDSHLIVWDEDNNVDYEFDGASRPSENSDGMWHARQESVWDMKTNTFRPIGWTSVDAAGLAILPGLVRPDEGLPVSQGGQGAIDHAIRFTLENDIILDQFLYPSSHVANPGNTSPAVQPPMGARFRLKASVDISGLDPESKIIAQAMKDYGLIVADNGSNFFASGASYSVDASNNRTLTWDDNDIQDTVHGLKSLTFSDFEVVDLTPVVTGLSTSAGAAGATVTVIGQNFAGAAGRLQVQFGGMDASNMVVIDDSHVTATVPPGLGTVDVQVQSGISTPADSENVESTIFGYGISATSASDKFTYSVNPLPPPPPVLEAGSDTGISNSDDITADTTLVFDLTSIPREATLELYRDGFFVGAQSVDPGGKATITDAGPVPEGAHVYTAKQIDFSGHRSDASTGLTVTVITTPPPVPTVALNPSDDSGVSNSDGITNVVRPHFTVTGTVAGDFYDLLGVNNAVLATATAAGPTLTLQPLANLPDGPILVGIRARDVAGNSSLGSTVSITVVTSRPATPGLALDPADDSGVSNSDGITNVVRPRFIVTAAVVGDFYDLLGVNNAVLATATAASSTFTLQPVANLPQGPITVGIRARDVAGNVSLGPPVPITIITTAPGTPGLALNPADDSGVSNSDGITNVVRPRFNVSGAVAGDFYDLLGVNSAVLATATAIGASLTLQPAANLPEGPIIVGIRARDVAGNATLGETVSLTIDTTPPAAPSLALSPLDGTPTPGGGTARTRRPHLLGTSELGATVQLLDSAGHLLGTATAGAGGSFTVQPTANLPIGAVLLHARAIDLAGNQGSASQPFNLTVLSTSRSATTFSDFDGDGKTDIGVFGPYGPGGKGRIAVLKSGGGAIVQTFGGPLDQPVSGDFDGDGKTDIAVYGPYGPGGVGRLAVL